MPSNRVDQADLPLALRDLLRRIRILEAVPPGGGIQFGGPDPIYGSVNSGGDLDVETSGTGGSGYGFYFQAAEGGFGFFDNGGAGMNFQSTDGTIGFFSTGVGGGVQMSSESAGLGLFTDAQLHGNGVTLASGSGRIDMGTDADAATDDISLVIQTAGQRVTVYDHTGAPIFQVRDNGSLHGKTGQTLTFDL